MPFFVGFMFITDMTLWRYWSTMSSSKNVPVAAVSTTKGLRFCCSTFIRLLYWYSTSEQVEDWFSSSKVFPKSQLHFFALFKLPPILFWNVTFFLRPSQVRLQVILLCRRFFMIPCL